METESKRIAANTVKPQTNLMVVSLLLLLILGPCFGPMSRYLTSIMDVRAAAAWQIGAFYVGLGIVFAWTLFWMRQNGRTFRDLGWARPARKRAVIVGIFVGVLWGVFGTMGYVQQFDPKADLFEMSALRLFTASAGALGAVFEDVITRGLIMEELKRLGKGTSIQVLVSSFLFATYHSIWWGNLPGFLGSFIASLIYGLMLSGLFVWGNRSLTPVILGHSLALIVGEPFLTLSMMMAAKM